MNSYLQINDVIGAAIDECQAQANAIAAQFFNLDHHPERAVKLVLEDARVAPRNGHGGTFSFRTDWVAHLVNVTHA